MSWLEISKDIIIVVLLVINTVIGVAILNLIKPMRRILLRDAESNMKEVQADIGDLRKEVKELHG